MIEYYPDAGARCIGLIERHAPRLLREGGGAVLGAREYNFVTDDERAEMRRRRVAGESAAAIARAMRRSEVVVRKACRGLVLSERVVFANKRERALAMARAGKLQREIAVELGLHRNTVKKWMRAAGMQRRAADLSPVAVARIHELRRAGKPAREIAAEVGCRVRTVHKWWVEAA